MWNLKYNTNQHIYETITDSQIKTAGLWLPTGSGVRGEKIREFGISKGKLSYIERINNEALLYSTGNYIEYPVTNHGGEKWERMYICVWMSNFSVQRKLIQHRKSIQFKKEIC